MMLFRKKVKITESSKILTKFLMLNFRNIYKPVITL